RRARRDIPDGHHDGVQVCAGGSVPCQLVTLGVYDVVIFVGKELAVAGVQDIATGILHAEQTFGAVDSHVELVAGGADGTHGKALIDARDLHAQAHFAIGIYVGERSRTGFETHGARVGNVVANNVQILRGCVQSAQALSETHELPRLMNLIAMKPHDVTTSVASRLCYIILRISKSEYVPARPSSSCRPVEA